MARRKSRLPPSFHGFLALDKPTGWTSHDVVKRCRRVYGQREVGHTGTLDPLATGLLVVALGRATRLARFVESEDKTYLAEVILGVATDTFDADGTVTETAPVFVERERVEAVLQGLVGALDQTVPAFSAVKVKGERLYRKARRGETVEAPVRQIHVHELDLLQFEGDRLTVRTRVSKGTYVRSLAVQIGERLGLPGHLAKLRRTSIGRLSVDVARSPEALTGSAFELIEEAEVLAGRPTVRAVGAAAEDVRCGRPLSGHQLFEGGAVAWNPGDTLVILGPDGAVTAMAEAREDARSAQGDPDAPAIRYLCVLASTSS